MKTQIVATVVGGLVLTLLQILSGAVIGPTSVQMPPGFFQWMVLANVLIAGVLAWFARRAAWTGWRLGAALFAIAYGTGQATALIEAHFFNLFPRPGILQQLFVLSLLPAVLFPPVMVLLAGRWKQPGAAASAPPQRGTVAWATRFAASCGAYLVLYFVAGTIIFPYVREFYTQLTLPPTSTVIMLQLFVRGPIFTAIGLLIVRMAPATRIEHALMVAAAMSLLGGVAPLIVPNAFFPDAVRWVHFAEVVSSNFVFGAIVGWLLGGTDQPQGEKALSTAA